MRSTPYITIKKEMLFSGYKGPASVCWIGPMHNTEHQESVVGAYSLAHNILV